MADKPRSNESRVPASSADVRAHFRAEESSKSPAKAAAHPAAAKGTHPTQEAPEAVPGGFGRYTVPAHLGSASIAGPDGTVKTYAGGEPVVMSAQDAERIGATPEGEPDHPRGGTIDANGSTRADQIPPRTPAPVVEDAKGKGKHARAEEEGESD